MDESFISLANNKEQTLLKYLALKPTVPAPELSMSHFATAPGITEDQ